MPAKLATPSYKPKVCIGLGVTPYGGTTGGLAGELAQGGELVRLVRRWKRVTPNPPSYQPYQLSTCCTPVGGKPKVD
jgi:hypothetical protein